MDQGLPGEHFDPETLGAPWPKLARVKTPKRKNEEDDLHKRVATLLSRIIARPGIATVDKVIWMSVEPRAKRSIYEGARNKARGCISGLPDVDIYHNGVACKIELKALKGIVSPAQRELHAELRLAGVNTFVCRSLEDVLEVLRSRRIPHRAVQL